MSALPQVYASEAELAASDAKRDTSKLQQNFFDPHQQYTQTANDFSPQQTEQRPISPQAQQAQHSQSFYRAQSPFAQTGRSSLNGSQSARVPPRGISPVPKDVQPGWQQILYKGAWQYQGNTFAASLAAHMPTAKAPGHADGPQHLPNFESLGALPDAEHRQAWSSQPTFRWFKRSQYNDVKDRWSQREGLKGRGDNTYRPLSVQEQAEINLRVERRRALKGAPRLGEW